MPADCEQAAGCPGCPLRHWAPSVALTHKLADARALFARIYGAPAPPGALRGAAPRDGFRGRLSAGNCGGIPGMRAHPGHPPVDLRRCPAQTPEVRAALAVLWADLAAAGVQSDVQRVLLTTTDTAETRAILTVDDANAAAHVRSSALVERPGRSIFTSVLGQKAARSRRAEEVTTLLQGCTALTFRRGEDHLTATLPAWTPQSPDSVPMLLEWAREALQPEGASVLELGCGVGTLSLPLARSAAHLLGVDCVRPAIADAQANATRAGVENAAFRLGFAHHAVRRLLAGPQRFDAILLHGMRQPFGERLMGVLPALGAARIAYAAPLTSSLADDLRALPGYTIERLDFLDQMPGTAHLMALASLRRGAAGAAILRT